MVLDGQELAAAVLRAEELLNAAHALSASLLEHLERDGAWSADGALSAASWTAERTGSARASIRSRLRQGRAMHQLPAIGASARSGRLSTEHLRSVSDCVQRHCELAAADEQVWLEQAEQLHAEGFRLATRHWLDRAADLESPDPADDSGPATSEVSRLHLSRTFEGWLRLDGLFAPEDAPLVETVLDAGVDGALRAARDGDPSVTGQPVSALAGRRARRSRCPGHASRAIRFVGAGPLPRGGGRPARGVAEPGSGGLRLDRLSGCDGRRERGPRRRPPNRTLAARHPSRDHRPGQGLRVPRLRSAAVMDGRPSLRPLERWWRHLRRQRRARLPPSSHLHPPAALADHDRRRSPDHPKTRRHAPHHRALASRRPSQLRDAAGLAAHQTCSSSARLPP